MPWFWTKIPLSLIYYQVLLAKMERYGHFLYTGFCLYFMPTVKTKLNISTFNYFFFYFVNFLRDLISWVRYGFHSANTYRVGYLLINYLLLILSFYSFAVHKVELSTLQKKTQQQQQTTNKQKNKPKNAKNVAKEKNAPLN